MAQDVQALAGVPDQCTFLYVVSLWHPNYLACTEVEVQADLFNVCADPHVPEPPASPVGTVRISPWFVDEEEPIPAPAPAPAPDPAPAPAVISTDDAEPVDWLRNSHFASTEAALQWLQSDCYAKVQTAVSVFGVASSADMLLLQAVQVAELPGIVPGIRRRMAAVLTNAVTIQQQVQMVYDRHTEWMQTGLGVDEPGAPFILQCAD